MKIADPVRTSRPWPTAAAAAGLLICTGGPSLFLAQHVIEPAGGRESWPYVYLFDAVAVCGAVALGRRLVETPMRRWPWPLFAAIGYVTWSLVSAIWSVAPGTTATAAVTGIGIAAFGCWFGWCLRIDEQITAVVISTACASLASALVIEFRPGIGKMYLELGWAEADAPWQGIFGNRNSLAPVSVLGLVGLVGWFALRPGLCRGLMAVPLAVVHAVLLRNSGGLTAALSLGLMAITAVAVAVLWRLRRVGIRGGIVAGLAVGCSIGAWQIAFSNLDQLASRVGRDATLTGRRFIWADVRSFIRVHPWIGHGFWAFWDRPDLTADTYSRLGPYASAHNSGLEVLLGLGVVGLVLLLTIAGAAIAGVFVWSWADRSVASWWWSMVAVFLAAHHLMESFVLWHSYIWALLLAAALVPFGPSAPRAERREAARLSTPSGPASDAAAKDADTTETCLRSGSAEAGPPGGERQ